jgi:cell division septal protein FtsQ
MFRTPPKPISPWRRLLGRLWFVSKCLVTVSLGAALVWGGMMAYRLVRDAAYFRLTALQIKGNTTLTRSDVLYLLALPAQVTLLQLDLERLGARLERHPFVKTVALRRRFPDTLSVIIQERSPYLVVVSGWERVVLDTDGVVLRAFIPQKDRRLPQLRLHRQQALAPGMQLHQREVQRALELVRAYKRAPVAAVMRLVSLAVEDSGASVWEVEPYTFPIRLGEGRVEAQLNRLPLVLQYIEQRDLAVQLVDLSHHQRIVVTRATS